MSAGLLGLVWGIVNGNGHGWTSIGVLASLSVAPIAGALSDRVGGRPLMATGLALQALGLAWNAGVVDPAGGYSSIVGPFVISGIGMGMFFAPLANVILGSVRSNEEGKASGANNAIREMGGVLGVAVLATIFSQTGGYSSPQTFVDGLVPATYVGAAIVALGALATLAIPRRHRNRKPSANRELAPAA